MTEEIKQIMNEIEQRPTRQLVASLYSYKDDEKYFDRESRFARILMSEGALSDRARADFNHFVEYASQSLPRIRLYTTLMELKLESRCSMIDDILKKQAEGK